MRVGQTGEHLAVTSWSAAYAARLPGLNVLHGETLAVVGTGTGPLLHRLADVLASCTWVDGAVAARGGVVRIHAQQAARVGIRALVVDGPVDRGLDPISLALAVADVAGVARLGLTTVVAFDDPELAARCAHRVAVVDRSRPVVAYPVTSALPRSPADVRDVIARLRARTATLVGA